MRGGKPIMGMGIIILISGVIFYLQGQSIVGPEQSFMYSNPDWITNGQWITIIGVIILSLGAVLAKKSSLRHPK